MSVVCSFTITETTGVSRNNEPIRIGIPFPKGSVNQLGSIQLFQDALPQVFHVEQTAAWPDGSVKWCLIDFFCSIDANQFKEYRIAFADNTTTQGELCLLVEKIEHGYKVDTGTAEFQIIKDPNALLRVLSIKEDQLPNTVCAKLILLDETGNSVPVVIDEIKNTHSDNRLTRKLIISGTFEKAGRKEFIGFESVLTFYLNSLTVKCDLEILNKNPAKHQGGTWDLGDPGSVYFSELRVDLVSHNIDGVAYRLERDDEWCSLKNESDLSIYQESSGGDNWCGNNHKNKHGAVPLKMRGYNVTHHAVEVTKGLRAIPIIHIESKYLNCVATFSKFWQNFPKAIDVNQDTLSLKVFPKQFPDIFELQGGEKKTHTFYFNFSDDKTALDWVEKPLIPKLPLSAYVAANAFPYLTEQSDHGKIEELIHAGIRGNNNFFEKREILDEFGWRNFGDLYADHEAIGYQGSQPLVSHYNNQYDPIKGFALQFVVSGDPAWFELMDDLAKHLTDIDIYHTVEDRDEYNGGLFWHTDHYLDASTCTHRTFSRDHNPESYLDYKKGGGPGNEHCYTTGLMYHYYLTGAEASKHAVLQLCNWMIKLHRGPSTFLDRLYKFFTKDIKVIRRLVSGESIPAYKFPLTRGTGNFINTLLDAYQLTNNNSYLTQVESIIQETIHPNDDIKKRNLGDIENTWSYTVFLQALCRYLALKEELDQLNEKFFYAQASLLAYASWMLEHEYAYLDKPEILEYPNQTWIAQEIRKANILYAAYYYSPDNNSDLLHKADYFYDYSISELESDGSYRYTRLLVLLMQNIGPHDYYLSKAHNKHEVQGVSVDYGKPPHHSFTGILQGAFFDLFKRLSIISLKNELLWLSFRSNYFLSLYNRLYSTK